MTKYKFSPEQLLYSLLSAMVIAMFCHLALVVYFADSEIWLLTLSQQTFSRSHLISILYKWSFHALTHLFSNHAPTELEVYYYARRGWLIVALCSQAIVAYSFTLFIDRKKLFLPIFIAIVTFSAFFNQGFRIRGDILSLFTHSLIMLSLFKLKNRNVRWYHYCWITFLNILLILSTPKSLYFYVAQFAFGMGVYRYLEAPRNYFLIVWTTHIGPVVLLLGSAVATRLLSSPVDLFAPIYEATDYYLKSFDEDLFNVKYLSTLDFAHVIKAFAKSYFHALVFTIGVAMYLRTSLSRRAASIMTALNIYFGILLLFVVFHNQKFPFFLGSYGTPLIAYTFILSISFFETIFQRFTRYIIMALCSAMTMLSVVQYSDNLIGNNNLAQTIAVNNFEDYINRHPDLMYYDIIGILPRKTKMFLFIGPGEISRKSLIINELEKIQPELILFTHKFIYLEPDIRYYLTGSRLTFEKNVWVTGDHFSIVKTMDYFRKPVHFRGKPYWVIPHSPKRHV